MKRKLAWFVGGSITLWVVTAVPAWLLWGDAGLTDSAVAFALCLAPMLLTLVWSQFAFKGTPEAQLAAALGGTGLRMAVVVVAGIVLYLQVPALNHQGFLFAVIGYYLTTLLLEVLVLVSGQKNETSAPISSSRSA